MTINLDTQEIKAKIKFLNGSDGFTSIDGGLLMSEIISVGDNNGQNAFISGITDDGDESIRFAAGADYEHKNDAPFKVLDNGKLIAENADIAGVIHADSGFIGGVDGWKITSTRLTSTTGKIQFGTVNSSDVLTSGISIAQNNFTSPSTFRNSFMITSQKEEGNINNIAADLTSRGNNINNTALRLTAAGGVANNALEITSGDIVVESYKGESATITYKDSLGNNKAMRFLKGLLVENN